MIFYETQKALVRSISSLLDVGEGVMMPAWIVESCHERRELKGLSSVLSRPSVFHQQLLQGNTRPLAPLYPVISPESFPES